jgi:predicted Zn-dependent protease
VDSLIEAGDLAAASGRIEALAKRTDDQARLDLLDSRRQKVRSYLPQMYAEAVTDYRNENFKDAIELLRTIVQVDVDFEQAADYLDKATAKEKLIEQY